MRRSGLEAERVEAERLEAERLEAERVEAERVETERLEAERLEAERVEAERLEAERLEAERVAHNAADAEGPEIGATDDARRLAQFLGVDLAQVPSTHGRVTRDDVGRWVRDRLAEVGAATVPPTAPPLPPALPVHPLSQEPVEVVPFEGMRGRIADRMYSSLHTMAQLTLSVDADMTGVNSERERRRSLGQAVPGYTAWVVAAAAQAIEQHGYVNSQITEAGVALLPDVHVGVAVALDDGLIVPVVEHANLRTVEEIHAVVADLAGRARSGRSVAEELEGSTFSVTALGMYGVDVFTPVVDPPNTAILGVGRLRSRGALADGRPVERTMMTLSLSWDHRAFDSAPAAEFAQTIVRLLEEPTELV